MGSLAAAKPTVVIVPGSASPAALYLDVADGLTSSGYETHVYDLRTASRAPPQPPASLADDAAFFHRKIQDLADVGKDVVVVAHSYGGLVASDAAKDLGKEERRQGGLRGGIVRIVYLTCLVAPVGEGLTEICAKLNFDWMEPFGEKGEFVRQGPEKVAPRAFSDVPIEKAKKYAERMSLQSARANTDKTVHAAYRHIPVSYIICTKDEILPPDFQQERVDFLRKEASGKVDVLYLDAGHCPNVTAPDRTARVICDAIEGEA